MDALTLSSPYNLSLSLNMTAISSFFSEVFRFGHKGTLQGLSEGELEDVGLNGAGLNEVGVSEGLVSASRSTASSMKDSFPGPWAFFTSSYMLGLLVMAILMHRIQHIVVPPPPPPPRVRHTHPTFRRTTDNHHQFRGQTTRREYLRWNPFPLDPRRTATRLALHLPTLYIMFRMLTIWSVMLLQVAGWAGVVDAAALEIASTTPSTPSPDAILSFYELPPFPTIIHSWWRLCVWVASQTMAAIAWQTFCAVCLAFCVEGFVKGLDGVGVGIAGHMQANTSPFNLVGYAFLLHIYSAPATHTIQPSSIPNSTFDPPSRPDKHVIFTIAVPLLQLTIFHVLSVNKRWSTHRLLPTLLSSILSLGHFWGTVWVRWGVERGQRNGRYPLLNYIPNLFESILISTTLLTVALNSLTQLLLVGKISRPLIHLPPTSSAFPDEDEGPDNGWRTRGWTWDEDFGVLLLRVGTASLDATALRGWGNQVGGVLSLPAPSTSRVVLGRSGVMSIRKRNKRNDTGFTHEISSVSLSTSSSSSLSMIGLPGVGGISISWAWGIVGWFKALGKVVYRLGRFVGGRSLKGVPHHDAPDVDNWEDDSERRAAQDEELYEKFLNGEDVSDDDEDWVEHDDDDDDDDTPVFSREGSTIPDDDALALLTDPDLRGAGEMLLAHLGKDGVVTRSSVGTSVLHSRAPSPFPKVFSRPTEPHGASLCVICTASPRDIIAWPCRCLALCDGCRYELNIRGGKGQERCPCCRSVVEGYSRVYLP